MVVWTPAARAAAGGTSAIQSLVLSSVANANLAYANSLVNARLRLVHSAEVAFTEGATSIGGDLGRSQDHRRQDRRSVTFARNQYGADIVTLLGSGYAAAGACGHRIPDGIAQHFVCGAYAFNVVDPRARPATLSYAHEVGHNQGLQHDPEQRLGHALTPLRVWIQDPGNAFRTVLSYGGATRVPYFSNPAMTYNGRVDRDIITGQRACAEQQRVDRVGIQGRRGHHALQLHGVARVVQLLEGCGHRPGDGDHAVRLHVDLVIRFGMGVGEWQRTGSGTAMVAVTTNAAGSRTATVIVAGQSVTREPSRRVQLHRVAACR